MRLMAVLVVKWQPGQEIVWDEMPVPPQSAKDFTIKVPLARPTVGTERGEAHAPEFPSMVRRSTKESVEEKAAAAVQGRPAISFQTKGPIVERLFCTSVLSCSHFATKFLGRVGENCSEAHERKEAA